METSGGASSSIRLLAEALFFKIVIFQIVFSMFCFNCFVLSFTKSSMDWSLQCCE